MRRRVRKSGERRGEKWGEEREGKEIRRVQRKFCGGGRDESGRGEEKSWEERECWEREGNIMTQKSYNESLCFSI